MEKNIGKEKILDKMRELLESREKEIMESEIYNKNEVMDIKYLGNIELDDMNKDVYLLIEKVLGKDGSIKEIEKYYTEDSELLAADVIGDDTGLGITSNVSDKEKTYEQLSKLEKDGKLNFKDMEDEKIEKISKVTGIEEKEIKAIAEVDLTKNEVEKVTSKQELDINTKVTDKETLEEALGLEGKGYVKIAVINSSSLEDNKNTTRFSFVGIDKDGNAHKIDSLEQSRGNNPTHNEVNINRDGTEVKEESVNSTYSIDGKDEEGLSVKIGECGVIDVSFVRTDKRDNNKVISTELETSNVRPTTREVREFMNDSKNPNINDNFEKNEEIGEMQGEENTTINQINDYEYDAEGKLVFSEEFINDKIDMVIDNKKIAEVYTRGDIRKVLENKINEKYESMTVEEIVEYVTDDMEKSADRERTPEHRLGN